MYTFLYTAELLKGLYVYRIKRCEFRISTLYITWYYDVFCDILRKILRFLFTQGKKGCIFEGIKKCETVTKRHRELLKETERLLAVDLTAYKVNKPISMMDIGLIGQRCIPLLEELKDATLQQGFEIICKRLAEFEDKNKRLEIENSGLKKNLARYSAKINEQEETIDAQDDKINFYVSKMNEHILKNKELEKEIDYYKSLESHFDEIEEDAKFIAKENAELKEQNKDLCDSLDIINNRESELLELIEKMKCCRNCKHWIENLDDQGEPYFSCEECLRSSYCDNYDKWELAE